MIERCTSIEQPGWLPLRIALWPHCSLSEHLAEMAAFLDDPSRHVQFVAYAAEAGRAAGFVEASIRSESVPGADSSPVAYLEGIYVDPEVRRHGIAASLVASVAAWASGMGCREFVSDAVLENASSQLFHRALGFEETQRLVFFRKHLARAPRSGATDPSGRRFLPGDASGEAASATTTDDRPETTSGAGRDNVLSGGCLCGGIRYEIVGPVGDALYCHCSMCRKAHGTAFRARLSVPRSSFRIVRGEDLLTSYRSSGDTIRRFCRICGSPIANSWDAEPDSYGLAMGSLDDDPGVRPSCHEFAGSKAPWYEITDSLPQHRAFPKT